MQPLSRARDPLVLFANGLGDHILNLPALRALAHHFGPRLRLVCMAGTGEFFFGELDVQKLPVEAHQEGDPGYQFDHDAVAEFAQGCDLFISPNPWLSSSLRALLESLGGIPGIGFFEPYSIRLPLDYGKHTSDLAFDVVRPLRPDLALESFAGPPVLPEEALATADEILGVAGSGHSFLAVHLDTMREKMLPAETWVEFIDRFLADRPRHHVLVLGTRQQDVERGRHGGRVIPCYGLPLPISLALVSRADAFVGIDSCLLHAADFFRTPGVGVFLSTDVHESGFRVGPHRHVRLQPGCDPAPAAAEVLAALEDLLAEPRAATQPALSPP